MKREKQNTGKVLDDFFSRFARPSGEQMNQSRANIWSRLNRAEAAAEDLNPIVGEKPRWFRLAVVAVSVLVAVAVSIVVFQTRNVMAEAVQGSLYRLGNGDPQAIQSAEKIQSGERIRSEGDGILEVAGGSRVQMRSESEVSLESADDGVRIHLNRGGIMVSAAKQNSRRLYVQTKDMTVSVTGTLFLVNAEDDGVRIHLNRGGIMVNAAKQSSRRLYVQTKDMTVSVTGTLFLVNAEEEGSRVAVVQGEVEVQHGATVQKLMPGEQVVTNPSMPAVAPPSLALLKQTALPVGNGPEKFEEVSIRLTPPPQPVAGGRGGGGGRNPNDIGCFISPRLQLTPGRLRVMVASLRGLIAAAYGASCQLPDGIAGEPEWGKTERYEIEALIPAGSPAYSQWDLIDGNAPRLQKMLQNLLADRFNLKLRREMREVPAYDLVVAKPGKWECHLPVSCHGLRLSENQDPNANPGVREDERLAPVLTSMALHGSIAGFAKGLEGGVDRPVIDNTGLKGLYDIRLEYPDMTPPTDLNEFRNNQDRRKSLVIPTVEAQLGFKFVPTTALVEFLIIEHVEKPSEN